MAIETHTGRLIFGDGQVDMEDGTVLAVPGATPFATAVALYQKYGETQPVTVTGTTATVDNTPVLFVTNIRWAEQLPAAFPAPDLLVSDAVAAPIERPGPTSPGTTTLRKSGKKKVAATQSAKGGSKK